MTDLEKLLLPDRQMQSAMHAIRMREEELKTFADQLSGGHTAAALLANRESEWKTFVDHLNIGSAAAAALARHQAELEAFGRLSPTETAAAALAKSLEVPSWLKEAQRVEADIKRMSGAGEEWRSQFDRFSEAQRFVERMTSPLKHLQQLGISESRPFKEIESFERQLREISSNADSARDLFDEAAKPLLDIEPLALPVIESPLVETNDRLESVERQLIATNAAIGDLGKVVSSLSVLAADMHVANKAVTERSLRTMYVSAGAAIVAVILGATQVFVSVYDNHARARSEQQIEQLQADRNRLAAEVAAQRNQVSQSPSAAALPEASLILEIQ